MLRCITIDELLPGMYVNQVLDDTGKVKVRSKGVVRSEKVIEVLRAKGVERVEIDCTKGLAPEENNDAPIDPPTESAEPVKQADKPKLTVCKLPKPFIKRLSPFSSVFSRN